jgi:hypothetical protein
VFIPLFISLAAKAMMHHERFGKTAHPFGNNHPAGKQLSQFGAGYIAHAGSQLMGQVGILRPRITPYGKPLKTPGLRRRRKPVKKWHQCAPIDWKVLIGGLYKIAATHPLNLASHLSLPFPPPNVPKHRVGKNNIKRPVFKPAEITSVSRQGNDIFRWLLDEQIEHDLAKKPSCLQYLTGLRAWARVPPSGETASSASRGMPRPTLAASPTPGRKPASTSLQHSYYL